MSHRLKLNAVHFSKSLEDEKSLMQTSQDVLESEFVAAVADGRKPRVYKVLERPPVDGVQQGTGDDVHEPRYCDHGAYSVYLDLHDYPLLPVGILPVVEFAVWLDLTLSTRTCHLTLATD